MSQEPLPGKVVLLRALLRRGLMLALGPRGEAAAHAIYHRMLRAVGRFDPPEDAVTLSGLAGLAAGARTIIDVGANVGRYSLFFRGHAAENATLYAFEPHPSAARLLRTNAAALSGIVCLEMALGDHDGPAALCVPADKFGNPLTALGRVDLRGTPSATLPIIEGRIDSLVAQGVLQIEPPVLLKIDVEGREEQVLRGAGELLARFRPAVYFECERRRLLASGADPMGVWRLLAPLDYEVLARAVGGSFARCDEPRDGVSNYVAVPRTASARDSASAAQLARPGAVSMASQS